MQKSQAASKVGMRLIALATLAIVASPFFPMTVDAKQTARAKAKHTWQKPVRKPDRDCVPINGRYGYYGNPWCDTGSSRPPDIEFRDRHRQRDR